MSINSFEILKPISRGAYGHVVLAAKKTTRDLYAIKVRFPPPSLPSSLHRHQLLTSGSRAATRVVRVASRCRPLASNLFQSLASYR